MGRMAASGLNIVVWGINYWPEQTGIAPFNRGMARFLAQQGHRVRIVSAFPYYPHWRKAAADRRRLFRTELVDHLPVHRCWHYVPARTTTLGRMVHELTFGLTSFLRVLSLPRADLYIVVSPPLLLGPLAGLASLLKRSRYVFHVQDLQPDAAVALGMLKKGWGTTALHATASLAYGKAALVSGISSAMIEAFAEKGVPAERRYLFPNWVEIASNPSTPSHSFRPVPAANGADGDGPSPWAPSLQRSESSTAVLDESGGEADASRARSDQRAKIEWRRRFGVPKDAILASYAGNLGRKQGLEILFDAAAKLVGAPGESARSIYIVIAGNGAIRPALEARLRADGPPNLRLLPLLSDADYRTLLATSEVCVITQAKGTGRFFLPSKLLTTLVAGRPVVAVADDDSELARAVIEGEFGVVVPPDDPEAVASALSDLAGRPADLTRLGDNGAQWVTRFESGAVLGRFECRLRQLVQPRTARRPSC